MGSQAKKGVNLLVTLPKNYMKAQTKSVIK